MSSTQSLFNPLQVGPITLKNRIVMAALTRSRSVPKNVPNSINVEHYKQRAAGGCGLIITEAVLVSQQGTEWPNAPGIWNAEQIAGWKKVTEVVHAEGGVIFAQLWHSGRVSHPDMPAQKEAGTPVWAPSAVAAAGGKFRQLPGAPGYVTPTEVPDPATLIALFKQGAINAKEAGFDGVELHGANGYLINQFIDSTSNQRKDKWGGSIENRTRFPLEAIKAVSEVWGADRVSIKLSPGGGYNDIGMPLEETVATFSYLIKEAVKLGVAFVELVRYVPYFDPENRGTNHDIVATYSPLITAPTRVFANAGFTPEEAAKAISEGKVDAVSFGVLWITHPDLAKRVQHNKALDGQLDMPNLYGHGGTEEEEAKGYNDYPVASYN